MYIRAFIAKASQSNLKFVLYSLPVVFAATFRFLNDSGAKGKLESRVLPLGFPRRSLPPGRKILPDC